MPCKYDKISSVTVFKCYGKTFALHLQRKHQVDDQKFKNAKLTVTMRNLNIYIERQMVNYVLYFNNSVNFVIQDSFVIVSLYVSLEILETILKV